jgi:putative protease
VQNIEQALETKPTLGERVMISSYCIRREIGQCLKHNPKLQSELFIEHGTARYQLKFDCKRCEMSLIDCSRNNTQINK